MLLHLKLIPSKVASNAKTRHRQKKKKYTDKTLLNLDYCAKTRCKVLKIAIWHDTDTRKRRTNEQTIRKGTTNALHRLTWTRPGG